MRHPTRAVKEYLSSIGIDPSKYTVKKNLLGKLVLIHKATRKEREVSK